MGNNYFGSNNNKIQSLVSKKINLYGIKVMSRKFKYDYEIQSLKYNFARMCIKK